MRVICLPGRLPDIYQRAFEHARIAGEIVLNFDQLDEALASANGKAPDLLIIDHGWLEDGDAIDSYADLWRGNGAPLPVLLIAYPHQKISNKVNVIGVVSPRMHAPATMAEVIKAFKDVWEKAPRGQTITAEMFKDKLDVIITARRQAVAVGSMHSDFSHKP